MITADAQGRVRGKFTVPANVPAGTKAVRFNGASGSSGEGSYTGSGSIQVATMRRVTTITEQRYDPLAQTFTLEQARHIAGLDLWFTHKGAEPVRVQIRETTTGLPNQQVLAETTLESADINVNGSATRFEFEPVYLNAGQEYAVVVLTDGADHQLAIAELGKYDSSLGWVTSQPYQVGVLLSSSNASTWTPHQSQDMAFRLLAAQFTETERVIDLGEVDATDVTDLMMLAVVERPSADTDLRFRLTSDDGTEYTGQEWAPLNLAASLTGKVKVEAVLSGSAQRSPVIYPGVQLASGETAISADYVTRSITAGSNVKLTVSFEAQLPGAATIEVLALIDDQWQAVPLDSGSLVGDAWQARRHILADVTSPTVQVKLVLSGSAKDRPRARSLRVMTT